jgi:hypothetical protein
VTAYLKRLASSLAAYQVADIVSKFMAVLLLPVYTRYINPLRDDRVVPAVLLLG